MRVGDSSYIMNLKFMIFRHHCQKHFNFVFDIFYTFVIDWCEIWFKFIFWRRLVYLESKDIKK